MVGISIHHPSHHLLIRADVRRRNIDVGSDKRGDLLHVAPRETLEFGERHIASIHDDATLGATEGQADQRAFPAHPHGQGGYFAERDIFVKPNPALRWTG